MRVLLVISLCCLVYICSSSPIDHSRKLINRPSKDLIFRIKRSAQLKGHNVAYIKGGTHRRPELSLRKGEYMCGNKVCTLQPGEMPKGCEDHICQYPLPNTDLHRLALKK